MITKQVNNFIGYGSTEEEALDSCRIISILKGAYNIRGFEGLEIRREQLSPWHPKQDSLHIRNIGYITIKEGFIKLGENAVNVSSNLFEMMYKCFFSNLSMVDVAICSEEIYSFLSANKIDVPKFSLYHQVVPEDVYMYEGKVSSHIITDKYSIVFFKDSKVAIKRSNEELYWTYTFDINVGSYIDTMYYIAYVRGYEGFESMVKGGNLVG